MIDHDPNQPISDGIAGELIEGPAVRRDGSKVFTVSMLGPIIAELDLIAGIVGERPTVMFVTSVKWGRIAREFELMNKDPKPENFSRLKIRNLTVVNAFSDDEDAVHILNTAEATACDFANRRRRLISGRR